MTAADAPLPPGCETPPTSPLLDKKRRSFQGEDEDFKAFSQSAQSLPMEEDPSPKHTKVKVRTSLDNALAPTLNDGTTAAASHTDDTTVPTTTSAEKVDQKERFDDEKQSYVTPQDFELLRVIGMGAFGKVLQVRNRANKKVCAMKVISKRLLRRKSSYVKQMHLERDILTKLRHPFIVTMHCSFQTSQKLFIVMDFLAGGELFLRLGREGVFLEKTAAFYLGEIILALEHLHGHNILHRDLKPENVLLSSDGHICLTDFGLSKDFTLDEGWSSTNQQTEGENGDSSHSENNRAKTICGTTEYMAPEMIAKKGYGKAADFWSLGCMAYEMLSGDAPFTSRAGTKDLMRKICNERVKMPDGCTAAACKLIKGLLNRNASARLGAAKGTMFSIGGVTGLKQVDFFSKIDWLLLEKKEIDPPASFSVDHDEDMRHFHDEFVSMSLPRSVTEIGSPRRCASESFRGFSFIQDDFHLPDRDDEELDLYWNREEGDGESLGLSECASSVFSQESLEAKSTEKKKRPPRKKKKKTNQEIPSLETTVEGIEVNSPQRPAKVPPVQLNDNVPAKPTSLPSSGLAHEIPAPPPSKHKDLTMVPPPPQLNLMAAPAPVPPMKAPVKKDTHKYQAVKKAPSQPPSSLPQSMPKKTAMATAKKGWGSTPTVLEVPLSVGGLSLEGKRTIQKQSQQPAVAAAPQAAAYKPAPGSWAARMAKNNGVPLSTTNPPKTAPNSNGARPVAVTRAAAPKKPSLEVDPPTLWPTLGGGGTGGGSNKTNIGAPPKSGWVPSSKKPLSSSGGAWKTTR